MQKPLEDAERERFPQVNFSYELACLVPPPMRGMILTLVKI